MRWIDLVWLPPVLLAVALVLGAAGRNGFHVIRRAVVRTFIGLMLGVIVVGVVIHVIANVFA